MSLGEAILDGLKSRGRKDRSVRGPVTVEGPNGSARVDVVDVDRLGAKVDRVRVTVDDPAPLDRQARALARGLQDLDGGVTPVEIDDRLGGGNLRSPPEVLRRRGRYYQVDLDGESASVERYRVVDDGRRQRESFTMTHEQLERIVDELAEGLSGGIADLDSPR